MAKQLEDVGPLRSLLDQPHLGVFSDIDGTLAPIVDRPEDAAVSPRARELLGELVGRGVVVALITGRSLEVARSMVSLGGVAYAANHGLSLWLNGREETSTEVREWANRAHRARAELAGMDVPGAVVEEKGPVLAVHYRLAPDQQAARKAILSAIDGSPAARSFRLHEGRKVIELRPAVDVDKGTALATLVRRLGVKALVCLGDDATDIDMFRAVGRLRGAGLMGATIAARSEEASPEVLASADYWVEGTAGVERLLEGILRALPERRR